MEMKRIIFEVFYRVWTAKSEFAKALLIPFVISVGLDLTKLIHPPTILNIVINLLGLAVYGWFAVTVHRLVLLGPDAVPEWGLQRITKREVIFVLSFAMITIMALVPLILTSFLSVGSLSWALLALLVIFVLGSIWPLYAAEIFESLATTFLLVFTVSALSIVYREITRATTF